MTPFTDILKLVLAEIPDNYKSEVEGRYEFVYKALSSASVKIGLTAEVIEVDGVPHFNIDLTAQQKELLRLLAYRSYLTKTWDAFNRGAIDFETLTFKVKNLSKRPENINDLIYRTDKDITSVISTIKQDTIGIPNGQVINWSTS